MHVTVFDNQIIKIKAIATEPRNPQDDMQSSFVGQSTLFLNLNLVDRAADEFGIELGKQVCHTALNLLRDADLSDNPQCLSLSVPADLPDLQFHPQAGCRCGCSPGFLTYRRIGAIDPDGRWVQVDLHIEAVWPQADPGVYGRNAAALATLATDMDPTVACRAEPAAEAGNRNFQLRAYTNADPVRLCTILDQLAVGAIMSVSRDRVADMWKARWPRHAAMTGRHGVRARITRALGMLRAAAICHRDSDPPDPQRIVIADRARLAVAAANLDAVIDVNGEALEPARWRRPPAVPAELRDRFNAREPQRLGLAPADTAARRARR